MKRFQAKHYTFKTFVLKLLEIVYDYFGRKQNYTKISISNLSFNRNNLQSAGLRLGPIFLDEMEGQNNL